MNPADPVRAHRLVERFLVETPDLAVIAMDPQGTVVGWLGAAERVLGYRADETVGQPIDALFTPRDRALGMPQHELAVAASGGTSNDDRWHLRRDGSSVWVTGAVSAVHDDGGRLAGFVKVLRDRTDLRMQLDHALARLADAQQAADARARALDTLGHELRTPLGAISHAAQVLARAGVGDAAQPALQIVERQLRHLQRLADDLLELTSGRQGMLAAHFEEVVLGRLVADAVDAARAAYDAKGIALDVIVPDAPIVLAADPARLRQILSNLIDNALKYTPAGGSVWVKATVEDRDAVIRVEDTGLGMPPHLLRSVFEMFTRGEDASRSASGVGIGLSLVKEYAELHGGTAEARSAGELKGSEFCVRLPLQRP